MVPKILAKITNNITKKKSLYAKKIPHCASLHQRKIMTMLLASQDKRPLDRIIQPNLLVILFLSRFHKSCNAYLNDVCHFAHLVLIVSPDFLGIRIFLNLRNFTQIPKTQTVKNLLRIIGGHRHSKCSQLL